MAYKLTDYGKTKMVELEALDNSTRVDVSLGVIEGAAEADRIREELEQFVGALIGAAEAELGMGVDELTTLTKKYYDAMKPAIDQDKPMVATTIAILGLALTELTMFSKMSRELAEDLMPAPKTEGAPGVEGVDGTKPRRVPRRTRR